MSHSTCLILSLILVYGWEFAAAQSGTPLFELVAATGGFFFHKADDGSLIVRESAKIMGTVFIAMPIYFQWESWSRFLPMKQVAPRDANAPYGVIPEGSSFARLIPPANLRKPSYEYQGVDDNRKEQLRCLEKALDQFKELGSNLTPDEESRLQGRFTQAFLSQSDQMAEPLPETEKTDYLHIPSTRKSKLRKPHWLDSSISDRYVLCLFDSGYVWQEVTRTNFKKSPFDP